MANLSDISSNAISKSELPDLVNAMKIHGNTALYDAICMGIKTLKAASERRTDTFIKNFLIVYTDGLENSSKTTFSDLSDALQNHDIPNFRFIFANSYSITDEKLVRLFDTDPCKEFCKIISVEDSKEGVTTAFSKIRQEIQPPKTQKLGLQKKSVEVKMYFGESRIRAEAVCRLTNEKRSCQFGFETSTLNF